MSKPWYSKAAELEKNADDLILASDKATDEQAEAIKEFHEICVGRLVFESNLIEGAGLPRGETFAVVQEYYPKIPASPREWKEGEHLLRRLHMTPASIQEAYKALVEHGLDPRAVVPSVTMEGKSNGYLEVKRHILAYFQSTTGALKSQNVFLRNLLRTAVEGMRGEPKTEKVVQDKMNKTIAELLAEIPVWRQDRLFTERKIREVHKTLAQGLLPPDAKVQAGEYRIDNRIVGWELSFPGPSLVPSAMKRFVKRADSVITELRSNSVSRYEAAARISHHFVCVHPFLDFNGRMSRLLMNMVLRTSGCPIPVAIRGDRVGRHRYITSLRRANGGDYVALAALIAHTVVETFDELNSHLVAAGVPPIGPAG